jgi:hypothetical protein
MRKLKLKGRTRDVVGFPTFWETVRSNGNTPQSVEARATSAQIVGRVVEAGAWEDDAAAFLISGNSGIHFTAVGHEVKWELIDAACFDRFRMSWTSDPDLIVLQRPRKDGGLLASSMDRAAMVSHLIGRSIRRLVTNEFGVSLHFQNTGELLTFRAQIAIDPERPFLEWFEDDE